MNIKILKDFLMESCETKLTLLFSDISVYSESFFNLETMNDFINTTSCYFDFLVKEEKMMYLFILFKYTTPDFDKVSVLKGLKDVDIVLREFKVYDQVTAGFSYNRKRFIFESYPLIEYVKQLEEKKQEKLINKLIEKYSPNTMLFLASNNNDEFLRFMKRKKISVKSFNEMMFSEEKFAILFSLFYEDKNNKMFDMLIDFFEGNKEKIIKSDIVSYFKFKSFLSIMHVKEYTPEKTLKDFIEFYNKNERNLNKEVYASIFHYAFRYRVYKSEYKKNKVYDNVELVMTNLALMIFNNKNFDLMSNYELSQCLKSCGFLGLDKKSLKDERYKKEYGSKKEFIINMLGLDNSDSVVDQKNLEYSMSQYTNFYRFSNKIPEVYFISEIMPFYQHLWLKENFNTYLKKMVIEKDVLNSKNEKVKVVDRVQYKYAEETIKIFALYLSLCDEDLMLSEDGQEILKMQFQF